MSQAVRLNLRMQKELQLLLSDPPPGVSLVQDSDDSCSASSLSNIEARERPNFFTSSLYACKFLNFLTSYI